MKTEYYVVVKKVGEEEGREVGTIHDRKVLRVPHDYVGKGLAMLMPKKLAYAMAVKLQELDDVDSAKVERVSPDTPPPPREVDIHGHSG